MLKLLFGSFFDKRGIFDPVFDGLQAFMISFERLKFPSTSLKAIYLPTYKACAPPTPWNIALTESFFQVNPPENENVVLGVALPQY